MGSETLVFLRRRKLDCLGFRNFVFLRRRKPRIIWGSRNVIIPIETKVDCLGIQELSIATEEGIGLFCGSAN